MKKALFFLILICLVSQNSFAEEKPKYENYQQALQKAKEQKKTTFLYFTAKWCGPCQTMKKNVIEPLLPFLEERHICYFLDVDKEPEVSQAYLKAKIFKNIPFYCVIGKDGKKILIKKEETLDREKFIEWHNQNSKK